MLNIGVVADRRRGDMGKDLGVRVGASLVSIDNGSLGCTQNHVSVWRHHIENPADWNLVLEDDALPVDDFREQAAAALAVAPAPIVSFYLGRGYIDDRRVENLLVRADLLDNAWLVARGRVSHAVALAVHKDLLADLADGLPRGSQPIDRALSLWARRQGHQVAYSNPSLVDHADSPSLVSGHQRKDRRAWRTGARDVWHDKMMLML